MTDPTQPPDPAAAAAGGDPPAAAAVTRPDWLPESHWDAAGSIKPEFGAHYTEIANFHKTQTETQAALAARKPEDIKIEVKLPDTVQVPDGMEFKIDESDPRVAPLRAMAIKNQWPQEQVNDLVAFDAQQQIAAHASEQARIATENAQLGSNGNDRKAAAASWLKGLNLRPEVQERMAIYATDALTIEGLEVIMARASGSVAGVGGNDRQEPAPKSLAERMYPNLPTTKAS